MPIEGTEKIDSDVYTLIIKYDNTMFETPAIVYNPVKYFASDKCTVYSNGEAQYATNFEVAQDNNYFKIEEITED